MKYRVLSLGLPDELFDYFKRCFRETQAELVMALNLRDAARLFSAQRFHLVIVDMECRNGADQEELLAGLRRASFVPIVILTDSYTETEARRLTSLGVDLLLSYEEPYSVLFSFTAAQLRRYTDYNHYDEPEGAETAPFQAGDLFIDPPRRRVEVRGQPVELRPREFNLLLYFMRNPGIVLTTEQICEHAWGMEGGYNQGVAHPVRLLRLAIEPDPKHPVYIKTVPRVGYRFTAHRGETCESC